MPPFDSEALTFGVILEVAAVLLACLALLVLALWLRKRPDKVQRLIRAPSRVGRATVAAWRRAAWRRAERRANRTRTDNERTDPES